MPIVIHREQTWNKLIYSYVFQMVALGFTKKNKTGTKGKIATLSQP